MAATKVRTHADPTTKADAIGVGEAVVTARQTRKATVTLRQIEHGECSAAWNMAVDEAILDAVAEGLAGPTIRFYRWDGPAISVGRFQQVSRGIDQAACEELGVVIVRRPTGGRGVLHGGDETVSIILPAKLLGDAGRRVADSYRLISNGFVAALRRLGKESAIGEPQHGRSGGGDCFAVRSQADVVMVAGEKLVGGAQCRRGGAILQQCSLVHEPALIEPGEVYRGPVQESTYPLAAVSRAELREALADGFGEALGARLTTGELTAWELERSGVLMQRSQAASQVDSRTGL